MTLYLKCPNGCTGEVPLEVEATDDGADDVYGPRSYHVAYIDDGANATSHDDGCAPLTEAQREALEEEGTKNVNDPAYGYWDIEP
jgi:hypothetical protein